MVQQMIDAKFSEYGLANSATAVPTCDKQPPLTPKKTPLKDLRNQTRNIVSKPHNDSSLMKEKGSVDNVKVCGNKRPLPGYPSSHNCNSSPCNNGSHNHLVYVRRKAETEPGKTNSLNVENGNLPQIKKSTLDNKHESPKQDNKMQEPNTSCLPAFIVASLSPLSSGEPSISLSVGQPGNGLPSEGTPISHSFHKRVGGLVSELSFPTVTTAIPYIISPQNLKTRIQQRQERFDQLQAYLKSCDESSQEEYVRKLRSLSSVGRSRHAIELEKRAIHLSLEEGKEFQRVMYLNVLGKSVPNNYGSPVVQAQFQQSVGQQ